MSSGLHLRREELNAIHEGMTDLLTPGAHPTLDAWRTASLRSVGRALGADWGGFIVRDSRVVEALAPENPRVVEYIPRSDPFDRQIGLWQRQTKLVVWSRPMLWGKHLTAMYRSPYFNEFARPVRAFDTIGLTVHDPGQPLTSLHFMHGSPLGKKFGDRGLALLRLLEPAMRVGAAAALRHFSLAPPVVVTAGVHTRCVNGSEGTLTPREHEVALLLAQRKTNREIGEGLGISSATAKRHTENILTKLGLTSRRAVERIIDI